MAFRYYIGQSLVTLTITVSGFDLSGSTAKILYRKPGGSSGEWTASITSNQVSYDISSSDVLSGDTGIWKFQVKVIKDSNTYYSKIIDTSIKVSQPI